MTYNPSIRVFTVSKQLILLTVALLCLSLISVNSYASFGGKIKNIRIKERSNNVWRVSANITGGNLLLVNKAQFLVKDSNINIGDGKVSPLFKGNPEAPNKISLNLDVIAKEAPAKEVPVQINLFDAKGNLLLSEDHIVPPQPQVDAQFFYVSLNDRKTASEVYGFYTAAPNSEALKTLFELSDMSELGYMDFKQISTEEFSALDPATTNYATGSFDPFGNLIRLVSEDGIVLTFERAAQADMEQFDKNQDWNTSWKSAMKPKKKRRGYKHRSGIVTVNIYISNGGDD